MNIFGKDQRSGAISAQDRSQGETSGLLFAAKQSWTTLRMSRPLFVCSYLHVTWWAVGQ